MFSSSSCTLINNSGHDHQDTENQTLMLQQEYHSSPFLFFHHDPFFLDHENDFLATHDDHQDPHQFLPQNHQLQPEEILLLGSCNDNNGGQEVINPAAAARSSSSSRGARSTSSNSNDKKKRSISDHGDGAKQPSQRRRSGKKDRHSKIHTAQGPRDRRMRLSLQIARKFFDLQDILGFDKASKTIEWLFTKSKAAIKELTDSNGGKSITTTVLSCTSESEVASSSAIIKIPEKSTRSPNNNHEEIKITIKGKKSLRKLPVFNPVGRDRARARARERTKEKMMNNMVKGCSSPPNPSGSNLEQEIMPTTSGEELQEGECSTDLLLQQEMDSVNLTDHLPSKPKLGDAAVGSNDSSSFLDLISQQQQQQQQQQEDGFEGEKEEDKEEEEDFSWYPVNYLDNMMNNTILPQAAAGMQYPFASFMNVSPIFAQQQRTSSLNMATTSSCIDQGQNNMVSTTTSTSSIFATQESVTLNFSNHHQINNTNTASGILQPHLLENYHLSCNPSYKFGSLF